MSTKSAASPGGWREPQGLSQPDGDLYDSIRNGDQVTIETRHGNLLKGRAVMLGPGGWVLNLGGAHGTPGIANRENVVAVRKRRGASAERVASAHVAQWVWLEDLANKVAGAVVRESNFGTELLDVSPSPDGVEAKFQSQDYGTTPIFFWRSRDDLLHVVLKRGRQSTFTSAVDYTEPPDTHLVRKIHRWIRDDLFDKDVHL